MSKVRVIDVHTGIFDENNRIADEIRRQNQADQTFLVNIMASPGAGKTSVLLRTIRELKKQYRIGVMEADIDYAIDAEKMEGECAMDAAMTKQALFEFSSKDFDLIFLENVGNLVCPAENDTGASVNVEILSVPEGDDKPLKYPLMFQVCQVVLINKIDTKKFFAFDDEAVTARIHALNPDAKIFFLSAKTGEGFDQWTDWLKAQLESRG